MPGYHKSYQAGRGSTNIPPRRDQFETQAEYEAARRKYMKAMFPQTLPDKTPEQMKIDRMYPEGTPYDDDAPAPGPMRMVKKNQDGTGDVSDNKGLMALGRSGPKGREAYENITGREFKEAGAGMKYRMGTGMADERMMDYGRKLMEHGKKAKVYQRGDGDMGGDSTMGATSQKPGAFSTGINQIGEQFNQFRDGVLNQLKEKDFQKLKEKGIDPYESDVWDIIDGVGAQFGVDSSSLLYRASRESGIPLPPASARQVYDRVKEGRIDPAKFDSALAEKGYGSGPDGEQAGQIFTQALTSGRLPLAQMLSASKTDDKGDRKKHEYKFTDYLKTMPTGYEFLEQNKKLVNRKGELKGDDYLSFPMKHTKYYKDISTPKPTDMGEMEGLAQQEPELPKDIQGDIVEQRGLVDPMATLPTEVPTKRPDPKPVVEQRPDPVAEERIKPGPPPEADPIPPSDTPPGGPLGTFDLGMRIANPSDRLGGGGATGRFADATLGAELRRKGEAAARAAEQERANINRMGSALKAKLNALGRKYNKFTMGVGNPMDARPRGMRFRKRQ